MTKLTIDKSTREKLYSQRGKVFWMTGLSASGKTTIADAFEKTLHESRLRTCILDGDNLRQGLNKDLGFVEADRIENNRRVAEVAKLMIDTGLIVIAALISPFKSGREAARALFEKGDFVEVYVDAPLEVAEQRDPKGLYKKARNGEIPNFTGIDSPYEVPEQPELHLQTAELTVEQSVQLLMEHLNARL